MTKRDITVKYFNKFSKAHKFLKMSESPQKLLKSFVDSSTL